MTHIVFVTQMFVNIGYLFSIVDSDRARFDVTNIGA